VRASASYPDELVVSPHWVTWRYMRRDGRLNKTPLHADGSPIELGAPHARWGGRFDVAFGTVETGLADGVGYVVLRDDPYSPIDIDHCRDRETGALTPAAAALVREFDSYTEITPSEEGVRIWIRGRKPPGRSRTGDIEIYDSLRYFTVTGAHLAGTPRFIRNRQPELDALHARLFPPDIVRSSTPRELFVHSKPHSDEDLIARIARRSRALYRLLSGSVRGYASPSEAMRGLLSRLSEYTQDPAQLARLAQASGLWSETKWARLADHEIADAIAYRARRGDVYDPDDVEAQFIEDLEKERKRRRVRRTIDAEEISSRPPAPIVSAAEFLASSEPDPAWLIEDLLYEDSSVLFPAVAKAGKTTFLINLIRSLTSGDPFLGEFAVSSPMVVTYCNLEMSPGLMRKWLRDLRLSHPSRLRIANWRGCPPNLSLPEVRQSLIAELRGSQVWIVDTWSKLFPGDENSTSESLAFRRVLDEIAESAGVRTLIVAHHMGRIATRGEWKDGDEHGRGSSSLDGAFDNVWILLREGDTRVFRSSGRDVGTDQEWIVLDYDAEFRYLTRSTRSREEVREKRTAERSAHLAQSVRMLVRDEPGLSGRKIRDRLPGRDSDVNAAIHEAERKGWIENRGTQTAGSYFISEGVVPSGAQVVPGTDRRTRLRDGGRGAPLKGGPPPAPPGRRGPMPTSNRVTGAPAPGLRHTYKRGLQVDD